MPNTTKTHTWNEAAEMVAQFLIIRALVLMVVLGTAAYCAALYHVDIDGVDRPEQVMDIRPDAPGSATAILAEHEEKCWTTHDAKGETTAVIVRIDPNDPYVYTTKPRLIDRAIDQAVNDTDRGLDRVLAFCTNHITRK